MELTTTKYKQSEIGFIPEDWKVKSLGDVGEVKMCKRIFNHQTKDRGDIPFYKIGTFGKEPDAFISKEIYQEFKWKYSFPSIGSVLISAAGTIGRLVVYDGEDAYFQDSNIIWIENNNQVISNEYLRHCFPIVKFQTEGGTIQRLYNNILKSGLFPCPQTEAEQKAIAQVLSDTDALIQALEQKIAKKKLIKKGVMQRLLTPKEGWKELNLGESATLKARIGWQGLTTAEYLEYGDYYLISGTDFKNGFINWDSCVSVEKKRYDQDKNIQVEKGDVLVTKDGTIGKVALIDEVPKPTTLNSGVFVIRPKNKTFDSKYFYYVLMSNHFNEFLSRLTAGSTISHLYQKDFVHFTFPIPSTLEEQVQIAQALFVMDKEIEVLEQKLCKYQQAKQGMMQQLLTGKIRLV